VGTVPRGLPAGVDARVDRSTWDEPAIFDEIRRRGQVADDEMARVFNLGIGMVVVVPPADADRAVALLRGSGHAAVAIGEVVPAPADRPEGRRVSLA
jgi:phosphoribosylformylglycinamidine cyclo-ligase